MQGTNGFAFWKKLLECHKLKVFQNWGSETVLFLSYLTNENVVYVKNNKWLL